MKEQMKRINLVLLLIVLGTLGVILAWADSSPLPSVLPSLIPSPAPSASAAAVVTASNSGASLSLEQFCVQVFDAIKAFGGIPWQLKVASIITLIIASMKVSILQGLWAKLGSAQVLLAPILGLIGGILSLKSSNQLTASGVWAYVYAGAGAIILHEVLDAVKGLPGIGSVYVSIINFAENLLQSPNAQSTASNQTSSSSSSSSS